MTLLLLDLRRKVAEVDLRLMTVEGLQRNHRPSPERDLQRKFPDGEVPKEGVRLNAHEGLPIEVDGRLNVLEGHLQMDREIHEINDPGKLFLWTFFSIKVGVVWSTVEHFWMLYFSTLYLRSIVDYCNFVFH